MYNNASSPIIVVTLAEAKKVFDTPQTLKNTAVAVKKARKDLQKAGLRI